MATAKTPESASKAEVKPAEAATPVAAIAKDVKAVVDDLAKEVKTAPPVEEVKTPVQELVETLNESGDAFLAAQEPMPEPFATPDDFKDAILCVYEIIKHKLALNNDDNFIMADSQDEVLGVFWNHGELFVHVLTYQPTNPNNTHRDINIIPMGAPAFREGHPGRYIGAVTIPHNGLVLHVFESMDDDPHA